MIFLENIKLYVDKIDKDFYESVENIRNAYKRLLPKGNWKGRIIAKEIIDLNNNSKIGNSSMFYSGGVNSTLSAILHKKEQPDFTFILGSDILQDNIKNWSITKSFLEKNSELFGSNLNIISSNFRLHLNENALTTKYRSLLPTSWWHDVQHGIALLGHQAPLAYINKYSIHYVSTSNKDSDIIASNPLIEESIKFCGCKIIHEGNKYSRLEKVKEIVNFKKTNKIKKLEVRVCFSENKEKNNCSQCEKCYRTICEIMACKDDPNNYGFVIRKNSFDDIKNFVLKNEFQSETIKFWEEIQKCIVVEKNYFKKTDISWLIDFDFKNMNIIDFSHEVWNENGEKVITKEK